MVIEMRFTDLNIDELYIVNGGSRTEVIKGVLGIGTAVTLFAIAVVTAPISAPVAVGAFYVASATAAISGVAIGEGVQD